MLRGSNAPDIVLDSSGAEAPPAAIPEKKKRANWKALLEIENAQQFFEDSYTGTYWPDGVRRLVLSAAGIAAANTIKDSKFTISDKNNQLQELFAKQNEYQESRVPLPAETHHRS